MSVFGKFPRTIIGKTKSTFFLVEKYKNNLAFKHLSRDV